MDEVTAGRAEGPMEMLQNWLSLAERSEPNDPNAAALATADASGRPSVRMVLVKRFDENGFRFFTNASSRKGQELAQNPRASLCMHWKSLRRQIRVEGPVIELSGAESDEYFHSRSRRSQIAAAISLQSRRLQSRDELLKAVEQFAAEHEGIEIPRPSSWLGFELKPESIEFWSDGEARLHNRVLFTRTASGWESSLLYP